MVFERYSDYYDRLYEDKDYRKECNFIKLIFNRFGKRKIKTILDFGCGTGSHAVMLSDMGYVVTGVDLSKKMLQKAIKKAEDRNRQIEFLKGNIQQLDLKRRFDAVLAMFNVLGYQTTNEEIENTLRSVRKHLKLGGLFICDVWFGPAVLNVKPSERAKELQQGNAVITRYARPVLDIIGQTIEVNYTISEMKGGRQIAEIMERHLVRFFFFQELVGFLERNRFEVLRICPFMDLDSQASAKSWNISVIGKGI
jgi:SAM-dependent methyltransferase